MNIVDQNMIRRATAFVQRGEKTAVWLSKNQEWEATALPVDLKELDSHSGWTPTRFRLMQEAMDSGRIRLFTWAEHKKNSGIHPRVAAGLEDAARESGADPSEWMCAYTDLSLNYFEDPEFFFQGRWMSAATFQEFLVLTGEVAV